MGRRFAAFMLAAFGFTALAGQSVFGQFAPPAPAGPLIRSIPAPPSFAGPPPAINGYRNWADAAKDAQGVKNHDSALKAQWRAMGRAGSDLSQAEQKLQLEANQKGEKVCRDFQQVWHYSNDGGITKIELFEITHQVPVMSARTGAMPPPITEEEHQKITKYFRDNTKTVKGEVCASPAPASMGFQPSFTPSFLGSSEFSRGPSLLSSSPEPMRFSLMGDQLRDFNRSNQAWSASMESKYPWLAPRP